LGAHGHWSQADSDPAVLFASFFLFFSQFFCQLGLGLGDFLAEDVYLLLLVLVLGGLFFKELDALLQLANVQCSIMAAGARRH
jgi:hypothetical protein